MDRFNEYYGDKKRRIHQPLKAKEIGIKVVPSGDDIRVVREGKL